MVIKFGQFKKLKWPLSSLNFFFVFFWKYTESSIVVEKLVGQWIPDCNWRGIAGNIKKIYFHFHNLKKNGNKVWTIYKAEMSQLCKLSQFCYNFLSRFENENISFWYPLLFPTHSSLEIIDQSIFPEKLMILYIFKKRKNAKLKRREGSRDPSLSLFYI